MSRLSTEEIYQALGNISSQFQNLECDKCAIALKSWSDSNGIEGKIIKLRTKKRNDFFIISNRYRGSVTEAVTRGKVMKKVPNLIAELELYPV